MDWTDDETAVTVDSNFVKAALELLADRVVVDESYYRAIYPDIATAIDDGKFVNAKHHYVKFGYFENRLPYLIEVDTEFYMEHNKDIAAGVREGRIPSCQAHFEQYGLLEGRLPSEGWKLIPDA